MLGVEMTKPSNDRMPQHASPPHDESPRHIKAAHDGIPQYIREIDAYIPGKPVEEVEREMGIRAISWRRMKIRWGLRRWEWKRRSARWAKRIAIQMAEVIICARRWRSVLMSRETILLWDADRRS